MTTNLESALLEGERLKVKEMFEIIKHILDGELEVNAEQALREFEETRERVWKEWKKARDLPRF